MSNVIKSTVTPAPNLLPSNKYCKIPHPSPDVGLYLRNMSLPSFKIPQYLLLTVPEKMANHYWLTIFSLPLWCQTAKPSVIEAIWHHQFPTSP